MPIEFHNGNYSLLFHVRFRFNCKQCIPLKMNSSYKKLASCNNNRIRDINGVKYLLFLKYSNS